MSKAPPCPGCGKKRPAEIKGKRLQCNRCGVIYDFAPHEGSDVFADPSRRLELQEEAEKRKRIADRNRHF